MDGENLPGDTDENARPATGNPPLEARHEAGAQSALRVLRRFVRPRAANIERCELCSEGLATEHQHLVEPASRQILCACEACAVLFSGQSGLKYQRVPRRGRFMPDFQLTDAQWERLLIPIRLAFFFHSTPAGKVVALYPSPAGATESLLELEAWDEIVEANPALKKLEPDVEALLVNRVGDVREHFIAPIDECYKLVGMIRVNWHGLSGGAEVWREIEQFFAGLKEKSGYVKEAAGA